MDKINFGSHNVQKKINNQCKIREYEKGDEKSILELFKITFGTKRYEKQWDWQFNQNPQGKSWITLALNNTKVIAQYCMFRQHLNYMGKEIVAGQSCDTMVHPEFRRNGIFVKLAKRNYRYAESNNIQSVIGFPGRRAYPGLMKKLKWNNIANMTYYNFRIGIKKKFGRFFDRIYKFLLTNFIHFKINCNKGRIQKNIAVYKNSKIPGTIQKLLKEHRDHEVLSIWKDREYLKWRYQEHPLNNYTYFIAQSKNDIETLVICREIKDTIAICEFIYKERNITENAIALQIIVQYYIEKGKENIIFFAHDRGFIDTVFKNAGFKGVIAPDFIFGGRVFKNGSFNNKFCIPTNWTVMYGDCDSI
jgi:hypothetical protein